MTELSWEELTFLLVYADRKDRKVKKFQRDRETNRQTDG